jgi:hypothetical protein
MIGIVVGVFGVECEVAIASGSTTRITTGMDVNVKQTLEFFQKVGIGHVIALTKLHECSLSFV